MATILSPRYLPPHPPLSITPGNVAAILRLDNDLNRDFQIFKEVDSPEQSGNQGRANVPYFL